MSSTITITVYHGKVEFTPSRRISMKHGWSGAFANKLFYNALTAAGIVAPQGGFFRVTPVRPVGGPMISSGNDLISGRRYFFEFYVWDIPGKVTAADVVNSFVTGIGQLDPRVNVHSVRVKTEQLTVPHPRKVAEDVQGGDPCAAIYSVRHGPTFYRFHGVVVSYPSPRRMLASIARRISMISTIDYKSVAEILADRVELYKFKVRRIKIKVTHDTYEQVFSGDAQYIIVASRPLVEDFEKLLEAAKLLGVGASPGLGLGCIEEIKKMKPPSRLPPPVTYCSP